MSRIHFPFRKLAAACLACSALTVSAHTLVETEQGKLNLDIELMWAAMEIDKNFDGRPGGSSWREGYAKYGFSGEWNAGGTLYGALNAVSSGTWGDGDPIGFTLGNERRTELEDAYLGWRSGDLLPALGENGLDISAGQRIVTIGDGFIINDDGLDFGNGFGPEMNRGGAYYLAARRAFHRTAVISLGGNQGLRGDAMYLKSNNRAQANTGMYVANLEYINDLGTLGLTWIHGKDVAARFADDFQLQREGMNIYSLRGAGNAGVKDLFLSFELARQYRDEVFDGERTGHDDNATAWYAEAGWTFSDIVWSPSLSYRYTRYGATWDGFFTGLNRGFGTWFQGEVANNYAGPFNGNAGIHHIGLKTTPLENLTLGLLYFDFKTLKDRDIVDFSAREFDVYAEWAINDHLLIIPAVGWYKPEKDQNNGGAQFSSGNNLYTQLMIAVNF